jgi:phosphoribosylformylglycinamidine synthase
LVPQREAGMTPYEMMLSESQERMLLVAERGREDVVFSVFKKWGLDAVEIGRVTADGMLRVKQNGIVFAEIPNRALADEAPKYDRPRTRPLRPAPLDRPTILRGTWGADLKMLLASGDVCSKRWIYEQYDHQVRTNTVAGPGAEAAVVRIKETNTSIAMSLDGNGRYCALDPREGTKLLVAECCRNLSTVGALPIATTNNLNFGNPERPEIMAQIVESIEGLADACRFFDVPVTGGNVSLYNETLGTPIFPTPVVGIVGTLPTSLPIGISFPKVGLRVVLLGGLGTADARELGGTQYAKVVQNSLWGVPPRLDMEYEKRVQAAIRELVRGGLVASAHDLSKGGLAVAGFWAGEYRRRRQTRFRSAAGAAAISRGSIPHSGFDPESGRSFSPSERKRRTCNRNWRYTQSESDDFESRRSPVRRTGRRVEGALEQCSRTPPP